MQAGEGVGLNLDPDRYAGALIAAIQGGVAILLATGTKQLKLALEHLKSIAKKHQAQDVFYNPAYPQGVPPVIELPSGVTTSLAVHHLA